MIPVSVLVLSTVSNPSQIARLLPLPFLFLHSSRVRLCSDKQRMADHFRRSLLTVFQLTWTKGKYISSYFKLLVYCKKNLLRKISDAPVTLEYVYKCTIGKIFASDLPILKSCDSRTVV